MKSTSRLITNVRRFFGFLRYLTMAGAAVVPFMLFLPEPDATTELGEVYFKSPTPAARNLAGGAPRMAEVSHVRGSLALKLETPEERRLNRIVWGVTLSLDVVLGFLFCHWIWRLCRNVENGETFTTGNLRLIRWLGTLLIVEALASFAMRWWSAHTIAIYVKEHLSIRGLEVTPPRAVDMLLGGIPSSAEFAFNQVIIGLLVLCLTAVFRQGLKLQQDADLTV
jgi:hypothetical protein